MYSRTFKKSWAYFESNYNKLESFLVSNLYARQMLISFVTYFTKIKISCGKIKNTNGLL